MCCANCKYLKESDKKEGTSGAAYYCTKYKKYVTGDNCCNLFQNDIMRKNYVSSEIYHNGLKYSSDDTSVSTYCVILIVIIIIGSILNLLV